MALISELVRTLALAWKSSVSYPPDHPSVAASVAAAQRLLQGHLLATHRLSLGALRDGVLHGDQKLDFPLARELGGTLFRCDVAVLTFEEGLEAGELPAFFRLLAAEPTTGVPRPLAEDIAAAGLRHVRVESVDFSGIRATEDLVEVESRRGSLWEEILRTVLTGKRLSEDGLRLLGLGQPASAPLIGTLLKDCLDQLGGGISGAALGKQVSGELGEAVGRHLVRSKGPLLRREVAEQIVELARSLPTALREVLLEAALRVLSTDDELPEPLKLLCEGFEPEMVLRAFQRLRLSHLRLSRHGMQLLEALSRSATPQPQRAATDPDLVRELSALFRNEDIDRFSPQDHQALLRSAGSLEVPAASDQVVAGPEAATRLASVSENAVSATLATSLIEALVRQGSREGFEALLGRVEELYRSMLRTGQVAQAVEATESLRALRGRSSAELEARVAECMARLASGDSIPLLVDALPKTGPEAPGLVRRLGEALGAVVIHNLLLALAAEQDRVRRRHIFDTLTALGPSIVDHATLLLKDQRWFVLRNMMALLRAVGDRTTLPQVRRLAQHADLRVRLEAIKTLFSLDTGVPRSLLDDAIASPDPKEAEAAVVLVGNYGIAEGLEPLLGLLEGWDLRGQRRSLRVKALRALGELGDPAALGPLDRFFKGAWLPVLSAEERRAAYDSLAGYPLEARAPLVQRGLQARDPKVRACCERLAQQDAEARDQAEAS